MDRWGSGAMRLRRLAGGQFVTYAIRHLRQGPDHRSVAVGPFWPVGVFEIERVETSGRPSAGFAVTPAC